MSFYHLWVCQQSGCEWDARINQRSTQEFSGAGLGLAHQYILQTIKIAFLSKNLDQNMLEIRSFSFLEKAGKIAAAFSVGGFAVQTPIRLRRLGALLPVTCYYLLSVGL